jgi:hypothetical protein
LHFELLITPSYLITQQDYQAAKDTVIRYERELLRAFGFIVHAEHPHNFVINYVHFLGGDNEFMQLAWNILNDRCTSLQAVIAP